MIDTEVLKRKIIELAIQGKLSEQLAEDGTAEELYCAIQEEKKQLVEEGKIKKEKAFPIITEEQVPFEIPASWKWVYMGDIFEHNTGKALNNSNLEGTNLEYITTSNVYWDHLVVDELKTMFFKDSEIEKCTVQKGDLLICEGGDIGRAAIWNLDYDMRIQNHIHKLRGYGGIVHRFYMYVMKTYKDNGLIDGRGIGLQGFSAKRVHFLIVPLPPISEQKRIVELIDNVVSKINIINDLQAQYVSNAEVLRNKIILSGIQGLLTVQREEDGTAEELFSKIQKERQELISAGKIRKQKALTNIAADEIPYVLPRNWKWVRLGDCINLLSGQDYKPEDYNDCSNGMPYMTGASNIENESLVVNRWTEIPKNISHKGDLLLVCKGSGYGKIAFNNVGDVHIARQFMALSAGEYIDLKYISLVLKGNIDKIRSNGQGLIPGIDRPSVLNLLLPLPPYKEQIRIVQSVEELLSILD